MDNALRLQYLEAMGITVWVSRNVSQSHGRVGYAVPNACPEVRTAYPTGAELVGSETSFAAEPAKNPPNADAWQTLGAEVAACTRCGLCSARKNTVFGSGNKNADWLFIGEGPGQHEDEQGLPFVGLAGQLLTEMIRALGLSRDEVFITNIVKCRPPNNRDPHANEVASCHDYLQRQIGLIRPKIILAVGRIAAQTLLDTDAPLSKLRGRVHTFNATPVVVVYHPAYLLRSLPEKRKAWQDLQFAMRALQERQ